MSRFCALGKMCSFGKICSILSKYARGKILLLGDLLVSRTCSPLSRSARGKILSLVKFCLCQDFALYCRDLLMARYSLFFQALVVSR